MDRGNHSISPYEMDALAGALVSVSRMMLDHPEIVEFDINPILADASGVIAVDARVKLADPASRQQSAIVPYPRRGDFAVTLYVVWEARAHLTYAPWGVSLGDIDLGTVTLPEHLPYHVAEIRAVLRTTPTER